MRANMVPNADPAADAPHQPAELWPNASVLVVDDEPGMLNFLQKAFAPRAGQVLTAGSAEEAETLLQKHRFDLLILDISLPGKSGLTWLKELREQGNSCEVVLITAFADLETAIEALRAGAGDFLLKPFRVTHRICCLTASICDGCIEKLRSPSPKSSLVMATSPAIDRKSVV